MEFSRQEYWSGLPFPSSGDRPNPGIEPESPALQADSLPSEPPGKPICAYSFSYCFHYGLLQHIEYTEGPCCLFTLYILVYIC